MSGALSQQQKCQEGRNKNTELGWEGEQVYPQLPASLPLPPAQLGSQGGFCGAPVRSGRPFTPGDQKVQLTEGRLHGGGRPQVNVVGGDSAPASACKGPALRHCVEMRAELEVSAQAVCSSPPRSPRWLCDWSRPSIAAFMSFFPFGITEIEPRAFAPSSIPSLFIFLFQDKVLLSC